MVHQPTGAAPQCRHGTSHYFPVPERRLPYTNEWRFFYLKNQRLSYGYYWSISDCVHLAEMTPQGLALAEKVAAIASRHTTFFTLDIAETEDGRWILVEINEGQMANLCENDPEEFYANLRRAVQTSAVSLGHA